jgi:NADH-quinone oxidoreductase subunit G
LLPKPFSFKARSWELVKTESIDVMDALGSAIRIDTRGREVMRILPRINEAVNEEWISDKTRQIVDGLKTKRLDRPYLRQNGKLREASWPAAFQAIAEKVRQSPPDRIGAIAGDLCAVEEMFALKLLVHSLGSHSLDCRQDGAKLDPGFGRASYIFNPGIAGVDEADGLVIIGSNPRKEAPVLNARIRKRWLKGAFPIRLIGERADLTYDYAYLGAGPQALAALAEQPLGAMERPIFLIGQGALARPDGHAVLALAAKAAAANGALKPGWNGFAILHTAAARAGGLDLSFVPGPRGLDAAAMAKRGALDVLFLLSADEIAVEPGAFVIYQGTHGDRGAARADVILPGAAYTEKSGIYVNTEGRVQLAERANFPPGDAREDWAILRALSDVLERRLPFDSLAALRRTLYEANPHFAKGGEIHAANPLDLGQMTAPGVAFSGAPFASPIADFYKTNPVARASEVMAECSAVAAGFAREAAE